MESLVRGVPFTDDDNADCDSRSVIELTFTSDRQRNLVQKRKRLSSQDKIEVIRISECEKVSARELANRFGVGKTQIGEILKNRNEILKFWSGNDSKLCKRAFPKTKGLVVDSVVYEWFCHARAYGIPVSGPLIREKALQVAKAVGLNDFKASCGWLDRFRARHNISYKKERGEVATLDESIVTEWKKNLAVVCDGFSEENIYSCEETELLFGGVIDKKNASRGVKTTNESVILKESVTVLLCVNVRGNFLKPLLVGKELKLKYLEKVNSFDIHWRGNKQAWLSKEIMAEWLVNFNEDMKKERRKVLLFLNHSISHPEMQLTNIKLEFFPPNTSTACQPFDQGLSEEFKVQYQLKLAKCLSSLKDRVESKQHLTQCNNINVLHIIVCILSAIKKLTPRLVHNCFIKAGFGKASDEVCDRLEIDEILHTIVDNSSEYTDDGDMNSEDPILCITKVDICDSDDNKEESEIVKCIPSTTDDVPNISSRRDADNALRKLRQYFLDRTDDKGLKLISEIECHLDNSVHMEDVNIDL